MSPRALQRILCLIPALLWLAACSSPLPSPTRTPLPSESQATALFGTRAAVKTEPSSRFVTATPPASATAGAAPNYTSTTNPAATETATQILTPTLDATTTIAATPNRPAGSNVPAPGPGKVWTAAELASFFVTLGDYPPEPPIARAANVNPLTGLAVDNPGNLKRRPILARIMNDPASRPQSGLNDADLVFEELIDEGRGGGYAFTRLTGVYLGTDATLGPFRSARLVTASLTPMFDGVAAHSGVSQRMGWILAAMPKNYMVDLNQYLHDPGYCLLKGYRDLPGVNWYASTTTHIHDYLRAKGLEAAPVLRGFQFADGAPAGSPVTSLSLDRPPWPVVSTGKVEWRHDPSSDRYLRFANGAPHLTTRFDIAGTWGGSRGCQVTTQVTSAQIGVANVVLIYASHEHTEIIEDSLNSTNVYIVLTGEGRAQILRDGVLVEGKWRRPTLQHFFEFVDQTGAVIPLKPGNTWFQIVPPNFQPTLKT